MKKQKIFSLLASATLGFSLTACEGTNITDVKFYDVASPESSSSTDEGNENEVPPSSASVSVEALLIDNFEDGDNQSPTGDFWYVYNDAGSGAESTIESATKDTEGNPLPTKADNGSKNMFQVNYTLQKGGYEYDPYVGWGVHLPQGTDCTPYNAIKYKYKGGKHFIHVELSTVTDSDHFMYPIAASTEWKETTIKFSSLAQEGWGKEVPFDAASISGISFQAKGSDTQDSVFIDDIYLINVSN